MNYYKGNFNNDYKKEFSKKRGWLVGRFQDGYRKTEKVAIKFWKFKKGEGEEHTCKYEERATECTFIFKGEVKGIIDGKNVLLKTGDYVVIPPKIKSNMIMEVIKPTEGLTIKAPSLPVEDSVKFTRDCKKRLN